MAVAYKSVVSVCDALLPSALSSLPVGSFWACNFASQLPM